MKYELPKLPYAYDALEPYIDARTMEIHHTKHHQAYVNNLNAALEKHPEIADRPLEELLGAIESVPEDIRTAVRNHGGGHSNHSFFWTIMAPGAGDGSAAGSSTVKMIESSFGGLPKFKDDFGKAAAGVFGSGWAWLALDKDGSLALATTPNQDSPLMNGLRPVLGLDVWEHAYYLKHQSDRKSYIEDWWNVVNWAAVDARFAAR